MSLDALWNLVFAALTLGLGIMLAMVSTAVYVINLLIKYHLGVQYQTIMGVFETKVDAATKHEELERRVSALEPQRKGA